MTDLAGALSKATELVETLESLEDEANDFAGQLEVAKSDLAELVPPVTELLEVIGDCDRGWRDERDLGSLVERVRHVLRGLGE